MNRILIILITITASFFTNAVTIVALNTEWLWDTDEPHEGQIVGYAQDNIPPPNPREYVLETYAIAQTILSHNADVVGLVEIENKQVAMQIKNFLGDDWRLVFIKGRDTYTGQDVAILTKYEVMQGTATNFPNIEGVNGNITKRPSKVLGVGLKDGAGKKYYFIVTHLISKRSDNDAKRLAQADALRKAVIRQLNNFDHFVVMGDINDLLGSDVLTRIRGIDDEHMKLIQPAKTDGENKDYSYIFRGDKQLIDHILIDETLSNGSYFYTVKLPEAITDHRMVVFTR